MKVAFFDFSQDFSLKGFFKFLPWFIVFIMVCVFTLGVLPKRIRFSFFKRALTGFFAFDEAKTFEANFLVSVALP